MLKIYIDADGCSVKDEVYKVARRCKLPVVVVANQGIYTPDSPLVEAVIVGQGADVADDWIAEHIEQGDIVITADIPFADRCLKKGARALGPKGKEFTEETIGDALASRALSQQLREMGMPTGGPAPMTQKDRSRFLNKLDTIIQAVKRGQ